MFRNPTWDEFDPANSGGGSISFGGGRGYFQPYDPTGISIDTPVEIEARTNRTVAEAPSTPSSQGESPETVPVYHTQAEAPQQDLVLPLLVLALLLMSQL